MKVWVFVEGPSEVRALDAMWSKWKTNLGNKGCGIKLISLTNKPKLLKNVGQRVVEKLLNDNSDVAVGLPDLYPSREFANTEYRHRSTEELQELQKRLVRQALNRYGVRGTDIVSYMSRFYASTLKHDLEVLLLAAPEQLKDRLDVSNLTRSWRHPPEEQNQDQPPKRIVQALFRRHRRRKSYSQILDSVAILRDAELQDVTEQCPTFRSMIDWIAKKTGVPAF